MKKIKKIKWINTYLNLRSIKNYYKNNKKIYKFNKKFINKKKYLKKNNNRP